MTRVAALVLAATFFVPSSLFAEQDATILTIDHLVPHVSTVPANAGDTVNLFVRERVRSDRLDENPRKAVLMIHGASVPVLPDMDLPHDDYSWARWLAQAGGFDVFMLDFQGSGRSPRPKMDDPCNAPAADQARVLIPNPLSAGCSPSYAFQLINSQSDWDELDAVVDYIRRIRGVDKVALVSWSQGSFRAGPYAVQHPEKVESLLFYSPIFNPAGRAGTGPDGFGAPIPLLQSGTPMTLRTRGDLMRLWEPEIKCEGQVEEGILDVIWSAIMDSDPIIGPTWGPPEGVMRVRSNVIPLWGWNPATAHRITVPVLIIAGEFDLGGGGVQDFRRLYDEVPHPHKLWFKVQCAGHSMVWERQRKVLHHISKEWLKHGTIAGYTEGKFCIDNDGVLSSQVQDPQDPLAPRGTCEWAMNP